VRNVRHWAIVMSCALLGFGMAFVAIVPDYNRIVNPLTTRDEDISPARAAVLGQGDELGQYYAGDWSTAGFIGPLGVPLWALFGDFHIDHLESERPLVPVALLVVFLVIAQVLALNLLIAMMTETYTAVMAQAAIEWQFHHTLLVGYTDNALPTAPPPFNLLTAPVQFVFWSSRKALAARERRKRRKWGGQSAGGGVLTTAPGRDGGGAQHGSGRLSNRLDWSQSASSGLGIGAASTSVFQTIHADEANEHRDETRAFYAYVAAVHAAEEETVGARVDRVASTVLEMQKRREEDREVLDRVTRALVQLDDRIARMSPDGSDVPTAPPGTPAHVKARSEENSDYTGKRVHVPDWRVPWTVEWAGYNPKEWTSPIVEGNPAEGKPRPVWADPPDARQVDFRTRKSFEQRIILNMAGVAR